MSFIFLLCILGWIDQSDIAVIPSFLGLRFEVAIGMHGATEEEWEDYHSMFSRSVRHLVIKIMEMKGFQGNHFMTYTSIYNLQVSDVHVEKYPTS